ncbi:hypothetical protein KSP40_PGU019511 [Platanthera guangdongensis]|uniref:Uncharacterized protein n=1 Tax=Platanthera guangdongensis TaxID=2320717 RepID=A0ABR2LWA2_9ASPA
MGAYFITTKKNFFLKKDENSDLPSIDAMEFCNESLLACASDFKCGGSAVVQLWDIESAQSSQSFRANDSVTSVSFSSCGTYFSASSTSNYTIVWDTRLVPTYIRDISHSMCFQNSVSCLVRPLHCLSHGKQMPTSEHAVQLPG